MMRPAFRKLTLVGVMLAIGVVVAVVGDALELSGTVRTIIGALALIALLLATYKWAFPSNYSSEEESEEDESPSDTK